MKLRTLFLLAGLAVATAQTLPSQPQPIYRVTIVQRTTPAINYSHRSEPTPIDFRGTPLLAQARGDAMIENRRGATLVDAHFNHMPSPARFGGQYLTYVLWAISPDGRAQSIGEIVPNGSDKAHLLCSTPMQAFALIVTAEPYFAVTRPSDVVVMENAVRPDTVGSVQEVNATYELLPRNEYTYSMAAPMRRAVEGPSVSMHEYEAILATYQAQNAIQIASAAGARNYAPDRLSRAQRIYDTARALSAKDLSEEVVARMREASQIAEDARAIAVQREADAATAQQRAQTSAVAKEAVAERAAADAARVAQEQAREDAERAQAEAARAAAAAQQARQQMEAETAARIARQRAAAEPVEPRRSRENRAAIQTRTELRQRLNAAFETLDSPRGLVVIVPDAVLQGGLGTESRLATVASAIAPYSTLRISIEGHVDSAEGAGFRRSEELARRVRDVLVSRGVSPASITAQGEGSSRPLDSNQTAAGRQKNRRVEIVISGEAIGNLAGWDRTYSLNPR